MVILIITSYKMNNTVPTRKIIQKINQNFSTIYPYDHVISSYAAYAIFFFLILTSRVSGDLRTSINDEKTLSLSLSLMSVRRRVTRCSL